MGRLVSDRTITVKLTEAQYEALEAAVISGQSAWEDWLPDPRVQGRIKALDNAWDKISTAWRNGGSRRVKQSRRGLGLAPTSRTRHDDTQEAVALP